MSDETQLKPVGYWCEERYKDSEPDHGLPLPWPGYMIDETWDERERRIVADYCESAFPVEAWKGHSTCRLCGCRNGSTDKSDGAYIWPEGFSHYILAHGVKPPEEFVEHVLKVVEENDE